MYDMGGAKKQLTVTEHLQVFPSYLQPSEEAALRDRCMQNIPWKERRWSIVHKLPQLAFKYDPRHANEPELDELCVKVAEDFDCEVEYVWCNLFKNPGHHIAWHQDQYGSCIIVLTLGGERTVEFRENNSKIITSICPPRGSAYFMSPSYDNAHHHRVLAAEPHQHEPRISLVFFVSPPQGNQQFLSKAGSGIRGIVRAAFS